MLKECIVFSWNNYRKRKKRLSILKKNIISSLKNKFISTTGILSNNSKINGEIDYLILLNN